MQIPLVEVKRLYGYTPGKGSDTNLLRYEARLKPVTRIQPLYIEQFLWLTEGVLIDHGLIRGKSDIFIRNRNSNPEV